MTSRYVYRPNKCKTCMNYARVCPNKCDYIKGLGIWCKVCIEQLCDTCYRQRIIPSQDDKICMPCQSEYAIIKKENTHVDKTLQVTKWCSHIVLPCSACTVLVPLCHGTISITLGKKAIIAHLSGDYTCSKIRKMIKRNSDLSRRETVTMDPIVTINVTKDPKYIKLQERFDRMVYSVERDMQDYHHQIEQTGTLTDQVAFLETDIIVRRDTVSILERELYDLKSQIVNLSKSEKECVICMSKDVDQMIGPCNHVCMCSICSQSVSVCPICRSPITSMTKCFL